MHLRHARIDFELRLEIGGFPPVQDLDAFPTVRALLERDGSAGGSVAAEGDHPTAAGVQPAPEGEHGAPTGGDEVAVLRTMTARAASGSGDGASSARQPLAKRGEAV